MKSVCGEFRKGGGPKFVPRTRTHHSHSKDSMISRILRLILKIKVTAVLENCNVQCGFQFYGNLP